MFWESRLLSGRRRAKDPEPSLEMRMEVTVYRDSWRRIRWALALPLAVFLMSQSTVDGDWGSWAARKVIGKAAQEGIEHAIKDAVADAAFDAALEGGAE